MIVIKDENSIDEALVLLEQEGAVRYSDRYEFRTIRSPKVLRVKCAGVLESSEGALIGSLCEELPSYDSVWPKVKAELAEARKKEAREWIKAHPEEAQQMKKRMGLA